MRLRTSGRIGPVHGGTAGRRFSPGNPWVLASALAVLALVLTYDPKLYINGDNVDYMNLARGVRQGHLWASDKFPPLFPMLLAPVQVLFGMRLLPQKILVTLFGVGTIALLAGIVRRRTSSRSGPWLLFAAATLIPFVEYSHYVMSEVPFMFFLCGAITACDRLGDRDGGRPVVRSLVPLALWIAAAFYTRTAGAAMAGGVLLWLLLSRRPRHSLILAGLLAITAAPWLLHAVSAKGGNPYVHQLTQVNPYYPELGTMTVRGWIGRLGENARLYFLGIVPGIIAPAVYGSTYSPPKLQKTLLPTWVAIPLLLPFAAGLWRGLRRRRPAREVAGACRPEPMADPVTCVVLASLLLLCLWPAIWAGSRFLVPVAPLLLLTWWSGWGLPADLGWQGAWDKVRTGLLVLLLVLSVRNLVFYARETREYPPVWRSYFAALEWIRENTPPEAVIVDRKPGFVEFTTGRKAQNFPREPDPARMVESFRRSGVTYVVLPLLPYDDINRFLRPALEKEDSFFDPVYRSSPPSTYVFAFHPEGGKGSAVPGGP
jgi:hypothetical protein